MLNDVNINASSRPTLESWLLNTKPGQYTRSVEIVPHLADGPGLVAVILKAYNSVSGVRTEVRGVGRTIEEAFYNAYKDLTDWVV